MARAVGREDKDLQKGRSKRLEIQRSHWSVKKNQIKRIILHPREYKYAGKDVEWKDSNQWKKQALDALENKGPLKQALIWNAGVYLRFSGITKDLKEGIIKAQSIVESGAAKRTLQKLIIWRSQLKENEKIPKNQIDS